MDKASKKIHIQNATAEQSPFSTDYQLYMMAEKMSYQVLAQSELSDTVH